MPESHDSTHRNLSPSPSTAAPPRSNSAFIALAPHGRTRCSRALRNRSASQAASFRCGIRKEVRCVHDRAPIPNQRDALIRIGKLLEEEETPAPAAIGHRVVHGGPKLRQHCLIDEMVSQQLECAAAFAPLHNPAAISVIRFAQEHFPRLPQVACFDTTFHAGMPDVARVLPVPQELQSLGIQRYGFHGLSCESIVHQLGDNCPEPPDHCSSRQWCQRHCRQGRKIHRHQHGINPKWRGDHGHPEWRSRPGHSGLPDARTDVRRSHAGTHDRSSIRADGHLRNQQRHAAPP